MGMEPVLVEGPRGGAASPAGGRPATGRPGRPSMRRSLRPPARTPGHPSARQPLRPPARTPVDPPAPIDPAVGWARRVLSHPRG